MVEADRPVILSFISKVMVVSLLLASSSVGQETSGTDALAKAAAALQSSDFRVAASTAEAELRNQPRNLNLWNLLGIARTELKNFRGAQQAFERGLALDPESVPLNENAGLMFVKAGDYQRAKRFLSKAVSLGSENPGVRYSLASSRLRTGEAAEARTELEALEPALGTVPDYWEERGRADMTADPKEAEADFLHATALAPANLEAWNGAASAAEAQGLDEKALAYLIDARKRQPNDVTTLLHFANVCIRRDLGPDAIDALKKARSIEPANQRALFLLARANISVGSWEEARTLFLQFLKENANYVPAYYAVAWVDLRLNRRDEARHYLDLLLRRSPQYPDALYELGQMDLEDGALPAAEQNFRAALKQNPSHARANIGLGDVLQKSGRLDEARTYYERAAKANPHNSAAHYKLAVVLGRQGNASRAAEERARAIDLAKQEKTASKTQLRLVLPEGETH